jgi:calcineurin-like phosphoesterase family protein
VSNIYFTSDWHLGHEHAAKARGFEDTVAHDISIMDVLNNTLTKRDVLWVLGDIAWRPQALQIMDMLDPRITMHAILGNHDKFDTQVYLKRFVWVGGALKFKNLWLTHIPIHPQEMFRAQANVHGHIHEFGATDNIGAPYINVNWDFWKRPVSLVEIREQMESWND